MLRKIQYEVKDMDGVYQRMDKWVIDTIGTNLLAVLGLEYIDSTRTISNNIVEVYNVLGIEAACRVIYDELVGVLEFDGASVNHHHVKTLTDRMTHNHRMISICRHGINTDNTGVLAKASFEETPEMFCKAARHAELDDVNGVSANVICG